MGLVSGKIPNMISGISQQAGSLRSSAQGAISDNIMPSLAEGGKNRSGAKYAATLMTNFAGGISSHIINRDTTERYVVLMSNGDLKVFDLAGTEKTVIFPDGKGYLAVSDPKTDFKEITVADYTFIVNKNIKPAMTTAKTTSSGYQVLVWFASAPSGNTIYNVYVNGTKVADYAVDSSAAGYHLEAMYTKLTEPLTGLSSTTWSVTRDSSDVSNRLMVIKRNDGAAFTFHATDEDNSRVKYCSPDVQNFEDLPSFAKNKFQAHIIGSPSTSFDDYYVEFVADVGESGNKMSQGYWKETVIGNITYALDPAKMPHVLIRNSNGTFTFKRQVWDTRKVGDTTTNKEPTFIGSAISDIFFYRNRLCFLADENVIASESGDYFNFWRTTVTTIVDSDPIDTSASHTKVSYLRHAAPFQDTLLLFSDQTQFYLDSGDILSGYTAAIKPLTEFTSLPDVRPKATGNNVYFATAKENYCGVMEYYMDETTGIKDAVDITAHIPSYIPATITRITASTNDNLLAVITDGAKASIFIYKQFWQGDQKIQSAWGQWTLTGAEILDFEFIDSALLLVLNYAGELLLLTIPTSESYTESGNTIEFYLDRKIEQTQFKSRTYANEVTTLVIPYQLSGDVTWLLLDATGTSLPYTVVAPVGGYPAIEVTGDYSTAVLYFGNLFTVHYRFSPQYIREQTPTGGETVVTSGRLQMHRYAIEHGLSGYFKVVVAPKLKEAHTYEFTGDTLGSDVSILGEKTLSAGTFSVPVFARNTEVEIDLYNDTYWPCRFLFVEWEGFYTTRIKRRV